jgi:hypothetical protein
MMDAFDDQKFDRERPPTVKGARRTNNNNSSIDLQSNCVAILGSALNIVWSPNNHMRLQVHLPESSISPSPFAFYTNNQHSG